MANCGVDRLRALGLGIVQGIGSQRAIQDIPTGAKVGAAAIDGVIVASPGNGIRGRGLNLIADTLGRQDQNILANLSRCQIGRRGRVDHNHRIGVGIGRALNPTGCQGNGDIEAVMGGLGCIGG